MILGRFNAGDGKTQLWVGRSNDSSLYIGISTLDLMDGDMPQVEAMHLTADQEDELSRLLVSQPDVRRCIEGLPIDTTRPSEHDVNCPYWGT